MAKDKNLLRSARGTSSAPRATAPAFVVPGGRTVTYKAFAEDVGRMANALSSSASSPATG